MASGNASDGVRLTSYTLNRAQTVHGTPSSHVKAKARQSIADFEFEVFLEEFKRMKEALAARRNDARSGDEEEEEEEEEEEKAKKEGEEEAEWLKQAGLKSLVTDFEADRELDIKDVNSETEKLRLTDAQREAVRRRVDTLNATIRRKRRASPVCEDGSGVARLTDVFVRKPVMRRTSSEGRKALLKKETSDGNIKSPTAEQAASFPPVAVGDTLISDLSAEDCERVRRLAFLELTTILETFELPVKIRKTPKRKYKETGIFGVPLTTLMARDKQLDPTAKTPLFLQEIIVFLEENGIEEEGILRIPGATARIRTMIRELEETFYDGDFSWDNRRTNDGATLLKQFLRDLPYPLLTHEYLHLFAAVDGVLDKAKKIEALNLLVLLLPDCHRATLRLLLRFLNKLVEHEAQNKMSINNVAMIMAPNLFLSRHRNNASKDALKDSDLQMAACTYSVMRMLIQNHESLWIVPASLLHQVRQLNETEKRRPQRGGVLGIVRKKRSDGGFVVGGGGGGGGAPNSPSRRISDDTLEQPLSKESQERLRNIIRVQSPHFAKVSMAFELTPSLTAGDIVTKFRKKSYENMANKGIGPMQHPVFKRGLSFKGKAGAAQPLDNHHLFEVGGNIGERCLSHETIVMAVLKANPHADWVIKQRELDF